MLTQRETTKEETVLVSTMLGAIDDLRRRKQAPYRCFEVYFGAFSSLAQAHPSAALETGLYCITLTAEGDPNSALRMMQMWKKNLRERSARQSPQSGCASENSSNPFCNARRQSEFCAFERSPLLASTQRLQTTAPLGRDERSSLDPEISFS